MTQITQRTTLSKNRRSGMSRAFEAEYCGSANATTDHAVAAGIFLTKPRDEAQGKPRLFKCTHSRMWKCVLEGVQGTGMTKRYAWNQMWALLNITHPHLKKPGASI